MPRAKSKKSEITREKLLTAAHQLFHDKGFENISVREITEAAGVSKGTFYLYFETKFDILKTFAQDFLMGFHGVIEASLSAETGDYCRRIGVILDRILDEIGDNECCMYLMHTAEMVRLLSETDLNAMFAETFIRPVAGFISRGIEAGAFRSLDADLYAKLIIMICHQVLESAVLYGYPARAAVTRDALYESILGMLKT